ncbi:MAG: hypothetical protein MSA44_05375 [Bacteroidales bacterium]|nr:hypothetical protein [Bacteroidales bacterium]
MDKLKLSTKKNEIISENPDKLKLSTQKSIDNFKKPHFCGFFCGTKKIIFQQLPHRHPPHKNPPPNPEISQRALGALIQ